MTENSGFRKQIGSITGGGLKENLQVRLSVPPQEVQEGSFIVIDSQEWFFYGIATDLQLQAVDPRYALEPSRRRLPENLAKLLDQQTLFTNLVVLPSLMLEQEPGDPDEQIAFHKAIDSHQREAPRPMPVKSIPVHHADAFLASAGDVAEIFGKPEKEGNFVIGYTREQNHPVCVDLDKLIQRSSGIFVATGSGKSFLTRMLLAGLIDHNRASVLVYDMHNEYGLDDTASDTGENVRGLRSGFGPTRVQVVGVGASATIRGSVPDFNLVLGYHDILPDDVELLTRELNLKETTPTVLDALIQSFGRDKWFKSFKEMKRGSVIETDDGKKVPAEDSVAFWANEHGVNQMAAEGLHDKLRRLFNRPYIIENPPADSIQAVIDALKKGKHIVLSFGEFDKDLDYLLISNLLTRRIREEWEKTTNEFRSQNGQEPRPLVIVVEEAHKLLNPEMAAQTTFSTIAREMRKYYVTLLVIDQRPSQIYDEVMSQLGTRVCGWLGDEDDIHAALSGLAGREALRGMLSRLQPKEEVLLLGWGVPMPILVRSRRYDDQFWKDIKSSHKTGLDQADVIKKLYPD
jgi:DNA helicase HerA-like ATPase